MLKIPSPFVDFLVCSFSAFQLPNGAAKTHSQTNGQDNEHDCVTKKHNIEFSNHLIK